MRAVSTTYECARLRLGQTGYRGEKSGNARRLEAQIQAAADRYEHEIRAAGERYDAAMKRILAERRRESGVESDDASDYEPVTTAWPVR